VIFFSGSKCGGGRYLVVINKQPNIPGSLCIYCAYDKKNLKILYMFFSSYSICV
jgi:hypothetical protein